MTHVGFTNVFINGYEQIVSSTFGPNDCRLARLTVNWPCRMKLRDITNFSPNFSTDN